MNNGDSREKPRSDSASFLIAFRGIFSLVIGAHTASALLCCKKITLRLVAEKAMKIRREKLLGENLFLNLISYGILGIGVFEEADCPC
jgi:hypothetical protein